MLPIMTQYFEGEKNGALLFTFVGLMVLVTACLLFPLRLDLRAFAITLFVWSLLELAIGIGLYVRTGPQVASLATQLSQASAAFYSAEGQRMANVQRNFAVIEAVWLVLILGSSVAAWVFKRRMDVSGIALGILINASFFLAFDMIAERRGAIYFEALRKVPAQGE